MLADSAHVQAARASRIVWPKRGRGFHGALLYHTSRRFRIAANAKRGTRSIIPITGGTTSGRVTGSILNGGADYQLAGTSGTTIDQRYTLAPSDGELIIVRNCGPMSGLIPVFEARADGPYAFLNENKYLSSAPGAGTGGVSITIYEK